MSHYEPGSYEIKISEINSSYAEYDDYEYTGNGTSDVELFIISWLEDDNRSWKPNWKFLDYYSTNPEGGWIENLQYPKGYEKAMEDSHDSEYLNSTEYEYPIPSQVATSISKEVQKHFTEELLDCAVSEILGFDSADVIHPEHYSTLVTVPGVPDLLVWDRNWNYMFLEAKSENDGIRSSQENWSDLFDCFESYIIWIHES